MIAAYTHRRSNMLLTDDMLCCRERLAQTQLSVEKDPNLTFA